MWSADNWTVCPRCDRELQQKRATLQEKVEASYGKVPADEYLALLEEAQNPTLIKQTLHENYEIGIYQDAFHVNYSARCAECGFSHEFIREDMPVLVLGNDDH